MTLADAWDLMAAADLVARAHGWTCWPVITPGRVHIDLRRGRRWRRVELTRREIEACPDADALRRLVEREVARVLADRRASA